MHTLQKQNATLRGVLIVVDGDVVNSLVAPERLIMQNNTATRCFS